MSTMSTISTLSAYIEGIGLLGPGLANWPAGLAILRGETPYVSQKTALPAPALLPPAERRRAGVLIKLTLAVGLEAIHAAGEDAARLPTVFASSGGDGDTCHAICEVLASNDRRISPTRFHNSVHNAAAGYWSIATGAMTPSSVLGAHDGSFCAGLLDAITLTCADHTRSVLLACDCTYPEPLHSARPIRDAMGIALVLAPQVSSKALAKIDVNLTDASSDTMSNAALEQLRLDIPAARGLPLLNTLAWREARTVALDYLPGTAVAVTVTPC